jgi:hypothetical protein
MSPASGPWDTFATILLLYAGIIAHRRLTVKFSAATELRNDSRRMSPTGRGLAEEKGQRWGESAQGMG